MNDAFFEELGRLVGPLPENLIAFGCSECTEIWYGHEEVSPDGRHPRPDRFCPNCGSDACGELPDLPGALVLKSWVEWPRDCPTMDVDVSTSEGRS